MSEGDSCSSISSQPRLSHLSYNAKLTLRLNQIERIEINSTYQRLEDGVTLYVLDLYVRNVQTGIPTTRKYTYRENEDDVVIKREKAHNPHYRLTYSLSDFYALRDQLRDVLANVQDPFHVKWCKYCAPMQSILYYIRFPSRYLNGRMMIRFPFFHRWIVKRSCRKLMYFLERLIGQVKLYRSEQTQCETAVNIKFILNEFLTEPRMSSTAW